MRDLLPQMGDASLFPDWGLVERQGIFEALLRLPQGGLRHHLLKGLLVAVEQLLVVLAVLVPVRFQFAFTLRFRLPSSFLLTLEFGLELGLFLPTNIYQSGQLLVLLLELPDHLRVLTTGTLQLLLPNHQAVIIEALGL